MRRVKGRRERGEGEMVVEGEWVGRVNGRRERGEGRVEKVINQSIHP